MTVPPQQPGPAGPGGEQWSPGPPPGRGGRHLLLLGGIGALLAVVLVVVLLAVFAGGSSPRDSAEAFVEAFNDRDVDGVRDELCEAERPGFDEDAAAGDPFGGVPDESFRFELRDVRETGDDAAEADIALVGSEDGEELELPVTVQLVEEDGEWRLCEEIT